MPYTNNFQRPLVSRIVARARRVLNQVPYTGEDTSLDVNVAASPATRFTDDEMIDLVNRGERAIISKVKAMHVPQAITSDATASIANPGPYEDSTTISTPSGDIMRLLFSRVHGNANVRARKRHVDTHRRLASSGLSPTAARPVYTYGDGEVIIYPVTGVADETFKYWYVEVPTAHTLVTDRCHLDQRFEAALVWYVTAAAASKLRRRETHLFAQQMFGDEIAPYLLQSRINVVNDDEVEVE